MKISDLKAGDFIYYKTNCDCEYVSIVEDAKKDLFNEIVLAELVCVCYNDLTGNETGYMWYHTTAYLEPNTLRLATENEKSFLLNAINEDGNYYDKEANNVYCLSSKSKKRVFKIHRIIELKSFYEDDIEVEAENLQVALNKAEMMNVDEYKVLEEINVGDADIKRIELSSENGEDSREVIF